MVSTKPRAIVLTAAVLIVAALAFLGSTAIRPEETASLTDQSPAAMLLAPALTVSPSTAVPNQSIALVGSGYTNANTAGGAGPNGVHQITGTGSSLVNVAGTNLSSTQVSYPINLDTGGNVVVSTVIPVNATTLAGGSHTAIITDDQGLTATATFTIPARTLTVTPDSSRRGTIVTATGANFPATTTGGVGGYPVSIDYGGTVVARVTPDGSGAFTTTFEIPLSTAIPSTNTVTATILGETSTSTDTHSVPTATVAIAPTSASSGTSVTVTGTNFPAFVPVTSVTIGNLSAQSSSPASADSNGGFSIVVMVPSLPTGAQVVMAAAGGGYGRRDIHGHSANSTTYTDSHTYANPGAAHGTLLRLGFLAGC